MNPRFQWAIGLILLVPILAFAEPDRLSVDDILRLHFAGVSEEIIISEVIVTDSVFKLSVEEILRLNEAGVSDRLLQFLVDTGRAPEGETEPYAEYDGDVDFTDDIYYEGDEVWVNEIEELEPTTTYRVSLNYSYPNWYYDCYWWDYWYYDHHYYPYQISYIGHLGAWYPAWYGSRWCWASPYWAYGSWYYGRHGYDGYYRNGHYDSYYPDHHYAGGRHGDHGLSDVKYKGGSSGRGTGLPLYADVGLKVPDGTRLPIREVKVDDPVRGGGEKKPKGGRLLVADRPDRPDDGRKPTKVGVSPDRGLDDRPGKTPVGVRTLDDREPVRVRTPTRTVRTNADSGRPVKVKTVRVPSRTSEEPPRKSDEPPSRPPVKTDATDRDTVKPSPSPRPPSSPPTVKPAPSTPPRPKVSSPPPRRPAPTAPPKVHSRPSRAPSKSPPSRGSPAPARPKSRTKR